jgi:hypothetical protein
VNQPNLLTRRRRKPRSLLRLRPEIQFAYVHGSSREGLPCHDLGVALHLEPNPAVGS